MSIIMDLKEFGWKEPSLPTPPADKPSCALGRVVEEHKSSYKVITEAGELSADAAGRLYFEATSRTSLPVVGDWVWIDPPPPGGLALIHGILPRKNCLSRLGAGRDNAAGDEEPLAANIDAMFIVTSLNKEYNASRLERYGTLAWENGIQPVALLNKADLCEDTAHYVTATQEALPGAAVLTISALTGFGLEKLAGLLSPGSTAVLLGSSGVGKSTLINKLMNRRVQETLEVRADDDKGRHATTSRSLIRLPSGMLLIDSPGLREVAFAQSSEGLGTTFTDIHELSSRCRFHDCAHSQEPGCAVQEALRTGTLSTRRFENYQKLLREQAYLKTKSDKAAALAEKEHDKEISRLIKAHYKTEDKSSF
jgi:ribosome biogenesis GTPase